MPTAGVLQTTRASTKRWPAEPGSRKRRGTVSLRSSGCGVPIAMPPRPRSSDERKSMSRFDRKWTGILTLTRGLLRRSFGVGGTGTGGSGRERPAGRTSRSTDGWRHSYAALICFSFSSALASSLGSPLKRSGCHTRTTSRYACRIADLGAPGSSSRIARASDSVSFTERISRRGLWIIRWAPRGMAARASDGGRQEHASADSAAFGGLLPARRGTRFQPRLLRLGEDPGPREKPHTEWSFQ